MTAKCETSNSGVEYELGEGFDGRDGRAATNGNEIRYLDAIGGLRMFRERGIETAILGIALGEDASAKVKLCARVTRGLLSELEVAWRVKVAHDAERGGTGVISLAGVDVRPKVMPEARMVVYLCAAPGGAGPAVRLHGVDVLSQRLWSDGKDGNLLRLDLVLKTDLDRTQLQTMAGLLGSSIFMDVGVEQPDLPLGAADGISADGEVVQGARPRRRNKGNGAQDHVVA